MRICLSVSRHSYSVRKADGSSSQHCINLRKGIRRRRKLQQGGLVASIVCASSGWCDDGRGGRYYDEGRDEG